MGTRVDRAAGEQRDRLGQATGGAEHAGRRDVLEDQRPGVDQAGLQRTGRCRRYGRPAPRSGRPATGSSGAVDASMTASNGRSGRVPANQTRPKPRSRANRSDRSSRPSRCTSAPWDRAICAASSPMVPGPMTSRRRAPPASARADGAERVAARLDQRPRGRAEAVRKRVQGTGRHEQLLGQSPGPAAPDTDLEPLRAQVLPAAEAARAPPAAEHRVPGDPLPDPGRGGLVPGPGRPHRTIRGRSGPGTAPRRYAGRPCGR